MKLKNYVFVLSLFVAIVSSVSFAEEVKEADVMAMIEKAVSVVNEKGDAGIEIIGKTDGEFHKGALYVFAYDSEVNIIAHPVKPSLVGKNYKGKPDIKGNKFRDKIVDVAINGGGWTEYYYQKPGEAGLYKKKVYSKLAEKDGKKYILACGMYVSKL